MKKGFHHTEETKEKLRKFNLGKHHSDATKQKISDLMKGRIITWKDKIGKANRGRKLSKEHIAKLVVAHTGKSFSEVTKQKMSLAHSGKVLSNAHKLKISIAQTGRIHTEKEGFKKGNLHPNWKGGITLLNKEIRNSGKYKKWRKKVFKRDNYLCQRCLKKGGLNKKLKVKICLEAHHKKEFYKIISENNIKTLEQALECKELWDVDNGETLCSDCHKLTDSYGINNLIKNKYGK